MRITTGMVYTAGINSVNAQMSSLLRIQQQISANRRILTPADDPVNAAQALVVSQAKDVLAQFAANQDNAKSALGLAETQFTNAGDVLLRVRELAIQANSGTVSASDKVTIAQELRQRYDELLGIANAQDGTGKYIFSGYMGDTKPFAGSVDQLNAASGNEVSYLGDEGQRRLQVSVSRQLEVSDSGSSVFFSRTGNDYFATNYNSTNTGTGMIDAGSVTDPAKWRSTANSQQLEVRFWVDPVGGLTTPGKAVGNAVIPSPTVTLGANSTFNIAVDGGTSVPVTVAAGTYTPAVLLTTLQGNLDTALGGALATVSYDASNHLVVTSATSGTASSVALSEANGGMATLFGTPSATAGTSGLVGATYYDIVDTTTGDSLFTGTTSTPGTASNTFTHAFSSGASIPLSSPGGGTGQVAFDFGAAVAISGTPATGDKFSISPSTNQSIFKTIASLVGALERGTSTNASSSQFANDIGTALTNLDQGLDRILTVHSAIGARLSEIDSLDSANEDLNLQYQQTLSNLQDLDYVGAISELSRKQIDLQAAQKSFAMVSQLSLFNFL